MTALGRWGRAGQRLTEEERRANALRAGKRRAKRLADLQVTYRMWRGGLLRPYKITLALDKEGLDGPEVDTACGASEPDVDLWEVGRLYPTWEQVLLLAKLTRIIPRFLCEDDQPAPLAATSMRFHVPPGYVQPPPVLVFDPAAIAATVANTPPTMPEP